MSTTQKRSSVGCLRLAISLFFSCLLFLGFLFTTLVFVESLVIAMQYARFPQNGVQTQATVVDVQSNCGKHYSSHTYSVQFTDQADHVQTASLSCESITLSRGDTVTVVYSPDNPTLIALPNEVGAVPGYGVVAAIVVGLIDLALLVCCIFWVRHEKHIISPLLTRRNRVDSRQRRVAEQVIFARPTVGGYVKDENLTPKKEQPESSLAPELKAFQLPQASQPELFEAQDEQE